MLNIAKANTNLQKIERTIAPMGGQANMPSYAPLEKAMTTRDIFAIIARHKLLLFTTIFITVALTIWYTFSIKPTYRASAIIQIEQEGAQIVSFGQTRKTREVYNLENDPFFKTRYEMLKSRVISQRVIEELDLFDSLNNPQNESLISLSKIVKLLNFKADKIQLTKPENPIDYTSLFQSRLSVQAIPGTHLVEVFYEAPSAEESKNVITALLDNFIKLQIESTSDTDEYAKEFLGKQLVASKNRLNASEQALSEYANKNGILKVDDKQTRHIKKLENLDAALVAAEIDKIEKESLYLQMKKAGSVSTVITNPVIMNLKARLFEKESEYQEKLVTFKPTYPDMKNLQKQIGSARGRMNKELKNIKASMKADYLVAKRQEERIRGELTLFKLEMHKLQDKNLEYDTLKREVRSSEKLYNNLLQRLEEVSVASAANTSSISVLEPPLAPLQKYRPNTKLNISIGMISGLFLGLGLAFLRDSFSQKIKSDAELELKTGLPILGRIPRAKGRSKKQLNMIVSKIPDNPVSEAYRILAANIQLITSRLDERIILISSPYTGDGKSVTASNIACAYAQMGKRVLLIDSDIRRPSLHKILGLKNESGLSNYLRGETGFGEITQPIDDVSGLYVITAGNIDSDPVSLLSNDRMEHLVIQGGKAFDYVIIDTPPVIGFADTLLLTSIASSTLIVANKTSLNNQTLAVLQEKLERIKHNLIGFSLVNVKNPEAHDKFYVNYPEKAVAQLLVKN
jgi:capsular exopolysaccharide synthesis family protein